MTYITDIWHAFVSFYEGRHEPENMRPLAEWYWRTLLTLTLVALALVLVFGTWEFLAVLRNLSAGETLQRSPPPEVLSKKDLADLLGAYSARVEEFDDLKRSLTSISDPSR